MRRFYLSFLVALLTTSWIIAQNIYVDSSAMTGSGHCLGSITEPYINLQDALTTASAGDTIFVAIGTYYPDERNCGSSDTDNRDSSFWIPDGVVVMGGYSSGFTLRDIAGNPTILSGDIDQNGMLSNNSYHVVQTKNVGSATVVDGFTITEGNANHSVSPNIFGGAWYNDGSGSGNSSNPNIRNCKLSGNSAKYDGGAIYNDGYNGTSSPVLTNCVLSGNNAGFGGAMASFGFGGESSPMIINCVLSGNQANYGGAMVSFGTSGESSPKIINAIFYNNEAGNAGPVFHNYSATPSISHSMFDVDYGPLNSGCTNCVDTSAQGNKFSTDPIFMNAPFASAAPTSDGDFHVMPNSPAIDMGNNTAYQNVSGPPEDLDGNSRIQNMIIDMGAYERLGCEAYDRVAYVDSTAVGDENGTTWGHAFNNLQDALTTAEACPGTIDTILVAKGTYYPSPDPLDRDSSFNIPDGIVVMGGFPSDGGTLEERDWDCHKTILSGDIDQDGTLSGNSLHVVRTKNVSSATVVDGFTITGGNATGVALPDLAGGGWYNDVSGSGNVCNPTLRNCEFLNNSASEFGGALFNNGVAGESSPELTNCVFSGNISGISGGAIFNNATFGISSPELTNCVLSGNKAELGGAMFNNGVVGESSAELINCVFSGNMADDGGAMYNLGSGGSSTPNNVNSIFYNNGASTGPVFFNQDASPLYSVFVV